MAISKRTKRAIPAWMCCLVGILVAWLALSGIGYALSGATTLDAQVGDISITAGLPVTYLPQVDGEEYVRDENGNIVYAEDEVLEEEAPAVVAWNYNGSELTGEVSAKYNMGCTAPEMNSVKATLVFTNTHASADMVLSFNYHYTTIIGTGGKLEGLVSGGNASESGTVTVTLAPGESRSISLFSGSTMEGVQETVEGEAAPEYGNVKLTLTNIAVVNANETYTATLVPANYGTYQADFVDENGSAASYVVTNQAVTPELEAKYPGATVVAASQQIKYRLRDGITLTNLAANDNFRFDHWQGGTANIGNTSPATVIPAKGAQVTAAYIQESYISAFTVGNQQFYSWNEAMTEALASGNPVILNQDYTFPATAADATAAGETSGSYVVSGDAGLSYILPAGVRFVVPKSSEDFGNFTNVLPAGVQSTTPITHYCTLTIPSGVTLQVNGAISVNGDYYCKQPYETVAGGAHGLVSLNQNAKISVSNGGSIWCYGFIAGAGEVEIASGGHAAELLQITDWGGGSAALGWAMNTDNLFNAFYFSQYYVQNIEAKLTVHEGATTEVAVAIVAAGQVATSHASFIGDGGLFHITEPGGYIARTYDASTDRTNYNIYGNMETSGITVSLMQFKLASDSYVLGINGNLSINVEKGKTTLLNDFMLLPGTEINVGENASVEVAQTAELSHIDENNEIVTEVRPIRLFIIDDYEWNNTIDTTADPLTQLQQLHNGNANYSYPKKQAALPYTIANGSDNGNIRGDKTEQSATINVDGEATFYSNVFTTNYIGNLYDTMTEMLSDPDTRAALVAQYGEDTVTWAEGVVNSAYADSKDKLITGSGTIINNEAVPGIDGNLNLLTQAGSIKNRVSIPVAGMLGALNGDGTYSEFAPGTYESAGTDPETGEAIWYKNQITYHFAIIDPATQQPTGTTLPDITHKTANDYDVLTADDLTVSGQRYAVFGFDTNSVAGGVPVGFIPDNGEIVYWEANSEGVKQPMINLSGDSQNRNFITPDNWNELTANTQSFITYMMSNGITSGWDKVGFVFADLSKQAEGISAMMSGGLTGDITLYVVPYDHYVAWENKTTGERAQSYLPSGVTAAQYKMDGEAVITPTVTDPITGAAVEITPEQSIDETEHRTTLSLSNVDQDLMVSMTAVYTRVQLTWKFVNASDNGVVYDTQTTDYRIGDAPAESPAFANAEHPYLVIHGDQHIKVADRYPSVSGIVTLSNGQTATGTASLNGVSLSGITEPVTIFVKVDAYDYKLTFTDDKDDAAVEDFYVAAGDDLTIKVGSIVTGSSRYCFNTAAVTAGTATPEVTFDGAELAITGIASDATIDLGLRSYDYLVTFTDGRVNVVGYQFVNAGENAVYTYELGRYSYTYTQNFNKRTDIGGGLVYSPAWENQPAVLTVQEVTADRTVNVQASGKYECALAVRGEADEILWVGYTSVNSSVGPYDLGANKRMIGVENPDGAVIKEGNNPSYVFFELPHAGHFNVKLQTATYAHYINVNFKNGGSAQGSTMNDDQRKALTYRIYIDEEGGSATLTTAQFQALIAERGSVSQDIVDAGDKLFFYLVDYSEQGSGAAATLTTAADGKSITASGVNNNLTVNLIVMPYANSVTVTDSGLGTTSIYYVDANGKNITNDWHHTGTSFVTYSAGLNRGIFGASGVTNCAINATAEQLEAGVDSVTLSNITGDASLTVDTHSTKHKLTVEYVEPWGTTTEVVYPDTDVYTASFTDRSIVQVMVTSEDGSTASCTSNGFTVTMPDAVTVTKVVVEFRYVCAPGEERLKYDPNDPEKSNITNATNGAATVTVTDSYYGVFTVECPAACAVAIDNGDGTWTRLEATPVEGDTYQFSLNREFPTDIAIAVVVKGDVSGDGALTVRDRTYLSRGLLDPSSKAYLKFEGIMLLAGDTDENGELSVRDRTRLARALLTSDNKAYLPFAW